MKRLVLVLALAVVAAWAATPAQAQSKYYCVKPDGTPVCAIMVPPGSRHDPSVLCNLSCSQCNLACAAMLRFQGGGDPTAESRIPVVQVRPESLTGKDMQSNIETPEYCNAQYANCLATCRKDPKNTTNFEFMRQCEAYCQSVRSGCGTGNSGQ